AGILQAGGAIDRQKLGAIVFADPAARPALEALVHPAVYLAIEASFRGFEALGARIAVADVPLLFETDRRGAFDKVIATVCPRSMQIDRLVHRGLSKAEAVQRLDAQMPAEEKGARADFIIRTDGTLVDTDAQMERLWRALLG